MKQASQIKVKVCFKVKSGSSFLYVGSICPIPIVGFSSNMATIFRSFKWFLQKARVSQATSRSRLYLWSKLEPQILCQVHISYIHWRICMKHGYNVYIIKSESVMPAQSQEYTSRSQYLVFFCVWSILLLPIEWYSWNLITIV